MTNRYWPDPRLQEAEAALVAARSVMSAAETFYLAGVSDRQHQRQAEAQIEARDLGIPYYMPRRATLEHDGHAMTRAGSAGRMVYRWIDDADLEERRQAFEVAQARYDEADAAHQSAVAKSKPLTEADVRKMGEKVTAEFAVNRRMKLAGKTYSAGLPIPRAVTDELNPWTVARWEATNLIRRLSNAP